MQHLHQWTSLVHYYPLTPRLYKVLIILQHLETNTNLRAFQSVWYIAYFLIRSDDIQVQISIGAALRHYLCWDKGQPCSQPGVEPNIGWEALIPLVVRGKPHRPVG